MGVFRSELVPFLTFAAASAGVPSYIVRTTGLSVSTVYRTIYVHAPCHNATNSAVLKDDTTDTAFAAVMNDGPGTVFYQGAAFL